MGVIRQRPRSAIDPTATDENTTELNDLLAVEADNVEGQNENDTADSDPDIFQTLVPLPQGVHQSGPTIRINLYRVRRSLRTRTPAIPVDTSIPPKSNQRGSKKYRRYENQIQLIRSCNEDEFGEVSIDDFLPSGRTTRTFARLLQDADNELRNDFLNPMDDAQALTTSRSRENCSTAGNNISLDPDEAFGGVCRKLRNLLKKRHFPLGVMEMLEDTLLEFFEGQPQATFESTPLDAFKRGILHALSQYNNLRSHSVKKNHSDKHKYVLVQNNSLEFSPPSVRLVHYLEQKYHTTRDSL